MLKCKIMENKTIVPQAIYGWGVDADPKNEPTYPIKQYNGDDHQRINWERPPLQKEKVEVLMSTERPYNTAVFGTPNPPAWLSGIVRRFAFRYSENMLRHWLPLLLADKINVVEGIIGDLLRFRLPNYYRDTGWSVIAKHNPKLLKKKIIIRLVAIGLITYFILRNKRKARR